MLFHFFMFNFPVRLLDPRATLPTRGSGGAAGFDVFALEEVTLPARATNVKVPLGFAVDFSAVDVGISGVAVYGRMAPRSGFAARHGVDVLAGVLDKDFRGEVCAILNNPGDADVIIPPGKAIAQIILELYVNAVTAVAVDELGTTARGAGGFGSTDSKK